MYLVLLSWCIVPNKQVRIQSTKVGMQYQGMIAPPRLISIRHPNGGLRWADQGDTGRTGGVAQRGTGGPRLSLSLSRSLSRMKEIRE